MKKLILFISFVLCFVFSFGQSIVPRSNGSLTVTDSNWFGGNSFRVPIFSDTTSANTRRPSLDSAGKVIFTRDINWFWGRQTSPSHKWVPFTSTNPLTPNCGNPNGYHLVTWDSLLYFDVTGGPYVLCCDNIPRSTNDTVIHLPDGDPDNPRIDAIILDQNGVNQIQGIPAANPALPQTDSCQIVLTYVLIAAGQTEPQNIVQTVIYDENDYNNGEWTNDSLSQVAMDTANTSHPVHLVKDDSVISYTTGGYMIWTAPSSIHLNDYSALKLYVRKTFNSVVRLDFAFYLDGVQATNQLFQSIPATGADFYTTIVIPISSFNILNTDEVNKLRIILTGSGEPIYIDWIQLQGGLVPPPNLIQGISSLSAGNNNIILANVTNPTGPNAQINIPLRNQSPYTIFRQNSAVDSIPVFGKLDLSQTQFFVNTLPVNLLTGGMDGQYLTTVVSTPTWTTPSQDTTFVGNWLIRRPDPLSNNDTLFFGAPDIDSSLLRFDTYVGTNNFKFNINNGPTNNLFGIDPVNKVSYIRAALQDGSSYSYFESDADTSNTNVTWIARSQYNSNPIVDIVGDAKNNRMTASADTIRLNSTLSGASSGYVWTLADPLTGSGYWAVVGGGTFPTLQQVFNTEVGGSVITKIDSIQAGSFSINMYGTAVPLQVYATGSTAIYGQTDNAFGIYGAATNGGIAINANVQGSGGSGVFSIAGDGNTPIVGRIDNNSTNTVETVYDVYANSVGTAAAGLGGSVDFNIVSSNGSKRLANQLISKWTTATDATRTSQLSITGVSSAVTQTLVTVDGDGAATFLGPSNPSSTITAINTTGSGMSAFTTSGVGINSITTTGIPAYFVANPTSTNTVVNLLQIERDVNGTAAAGVGGDIRWALETASGSGLISNKLISTWTDAAAVTATSQFKITGMLSAATVDVFTANGDGSWQIRPITATAASAITPAEGMILFVSNTNGTFVSIGPWCYYNGAWHAL